MLTFAHEPGLVSEKSRVFCHSIKKMYLSRTILRKDSQELTHSVNQTYYPIEKCQFSYSFLYQAMDVRHKA